MHRLWCDQQQRLWREQTCLWVDGHHRHNWRRTLWRREYQHNQHWFRFWWRLRRDDDDQHVRRRREHHRWRSFRQQQQPEQAGLRRLYDGRRFALRRRRQHCHSINWLWFWLNRLWGYRWRQRPSGYWQHAFPSTHREGNHVKHDELVPEHHLPGSLQEVVS